MTSHALVYIYIHVHFECVSTKKWTHVFNDSAMQLHTHPSVGTIITLDLPG